MKKFLLACMLVCVASQPTAFAQHSEQPSQQMSRSLQAACYIGVMAFFGYVLSQAFTQDNWRLLRKSWFEDCLQDYKIAEGLCYKDFEDVFAWYDLREGDINYIFSYAYHHSNNGIITKQGLQEAVDYLIILIEGEGYDEEEKQDEYEL